MPAGSRRPTLRRRPRALVVNAYFDDYRLNVGSPRKVPQAMGHVYLAGAFHPERCDVQVYNEQVSGPFSDLGLLEWADVLVLTGLTASLDRLRQLTAYARTLNPAIVVVAGGPTVRALPRFTSEVFDYSCAGDIEELRDVITEVFGPEYAAEEMMPRYDLVRSIGFVGYVESSRYCNFSCSFCSLSGEGRSYRAYDIEYLRRQILAQGRRTTVLFIDNNFYGNDRRFFLERLELLRELRREGHLKRWGALVTADFFANPDNVHLAREAGCHALFSGVESFDADLLKRYRKKQNTILPQVEMIRGCLEAGVLFLYGLMLDPTTRSLESLAAELDFILDEPAITLPSFLTMAIPLLGTPYFRECLEDGVILPRTRLRDMDGLTVVTRCVDPPEAVAGFLGDVVTKRGRRTRILRHGARFLARYRKSLDWATLAATGINASLFAMPASVTAKLPLGRAPKRTYLGATEPLDPQYTPSIRVDGRYESYFAPVLVTDGAGAIHPMLADDLQPADRATRLPMLDAG